MQRVLNYIGERPSRGVSPLARAQPWDDELVCSSGLPTPALPEPKHISTKRSTDFPFSGRALRSGPTS